MKWIGVRDAAHFFEQINLYSKGFEQVRSLVEQEQYSEALHEYRQLLKERLVSEKCEFPVPCPVDGADALLENKLSLLNSPLIELGEPIDWLLAPNGDKQWQSHLGYFYFNFYLLEAYERTGELKYLKKWMDIFNDFLEHHRWGTEGLEYDVSIPVYVNEKGYKHGGEGRTPGYLGGSWIGLAAASRIENWIIALRHVIRDDHVPDVFIANVLYSLATDHVYMVLNNARRYTPNQFVHCASTLVLFGRVLNEFKIAPACYYVGMDRLEEALDICVLPDGTDPEQSFGYNLGIVPRIHEIVSLFEGIHNRRVEALREKAEMRCAFLASLLTPLKNLPAVAKSANPTEENAGFAMCNLKNKSSLFPGCSALELINEIEAGEENVASSVAFPYGGYYAFRSGWKEKDNYLFFKTSRFGMGHAHEDCNSIVLTALGKDLLIDTGNFNYSDDPVSKKINDYFMSSFSHNTVCINGLSQTRKDFVAKNRDMVTEEWKDCEEYLDSLLRLRERDGTEYHLGEILQYAEGYYKDGYGDERLDAVHHRQVFSLNHQCYVVVDRITGGDHFQLNWNLSEYCTNTGFSDNCLVTKAEDVTLEILHLGAPLSCEIHNGSEEPFVGWCCFGYDKKEATDHVSLTWENKGLLVSVLMPYVTEKPVITVEKETDEIKFSVTTGGCEGNFSFTKEHSTVTVIKNDKKEVFER